MEGNKEKASISLFVLIACLFFVFILAGAYINSLNKLQTQEQSISQIQDNYKRNIANAGEYVNEITGNVTMEQIFNLVYPIGSIYMSEKSTSPETLFGGTWQQIQDTFVLAAGSKYAAGSTGGESSHILTTAEMPSHSHVINGMNISATSSPTFLSMQGDGNLVLYTSSGVAWATGINSGAQNYKAVDFGRGSTTTTQVGSTAAHNNMPPYLTVYMWKRIS